MKSNENYVHTDHEYSEKKRRKKKQLIYDSRKYVY